MALSKPDLLIYEIWLIGPFYNFGTEGGGWGYGVGGYAQNWTSKEGGLS